MSILDLKSNLSNFRKPTTVKEQEKQKLKESPIIKPVYSASNELKNILDIKINKVDNSTSIQVPGAKKIDYKLFSISASRRRGIPAISTLFGKAILDKAVEYGFKGDFKMTGKTATFTGEKSTAQKIGATAAGVTSTRRKAE